MRNNQYGRRFCKALYLLTFSLMAVSAVGQESRKLVAAPAPSYPQLARRDQLTGTVKVLVTIAPDGHIKEAKVVGGHPLFVSATLDTLKNWKYASSNADTTAILEFNFHP
ncbi:MAG: energy transducer TonB [Candidatus Acidiferrum sp.]|jgi:TonB family protein